MRICPRCGRENNNNNKYCDQCGTVLAGMETSKSSRTAFVLLSAVTVILTVLFVSVVVLLVKRTASPPETPSADAATEQKAEEAVDEDEPETTSQELAFPEGALSYNSHHYYIYENDAGNWSEALEKCKERGGYLAVINDEEENEALFEYMVNNGFDAVYFGMTDRENEGEWKYLYGDESSFTDWGYNSKGVAEPNNADSGEQYAELDIHMNGGHWNDGEFGRQTYTPEGDEYRNKYAYICEWEQ